MKAININLSNKVNIVIRSSRDKDRDEYKDRKDREDRKSREENRNNSNINSSYLDLNLRYINSKS